jgi:hypothetical protein
MALAIPQSITFGNGIPVIEGDKDIRRFDVAMDYPFLVRVLDRMADREKELEPVHRTEAVLIAVFSDPNAAHQLHDKKGPAILRGAAIENLGDIRMIHHCQGLPFGFESGHDLFGVHPGLDDLQRDAAADGFDLFGHPDLTHAALAEPLEEFVAPGESGGVPCGQDSGFAGVDGPESSEGGPGTRLKRRIVRNSRLQPRDVATCKAAEFLTALLTLPEMLFRRVNLCRRQFALQQRGQLDHSWTS